MLELTEHIQTYGRELVSVTIGLAAGIGHYILEKNNADLEGLAKTTVPNAVALGIVSMLVTQGLDAESVTMNIINGAITGTVYATAYHSAKIPKYRSEHAQARRQKEDKELDDLFD